MEQQDAGKIKKLIDQHQQVTIICHKNPDGDAIGSSLGLGLALRELGKDVTMVCPDQYPNFLSWLPGCQDILVAKKNVGKAREAIKTAEVLFCLDFNSTQRVDFLGEAIEKSGAAKVMIDHHPQPSDFAPIRYWDDTASSTAEMVHRLLVEIDLREAITKDSATALYTGVMTDTGSFQFPATTSKVHQMVADLLTAGIKVAGIHQRVLYSHSEKRLRFFGHCISNRMEVFAESHAAMIYVTAADLEEFEIKQGGTEGLVNQPLQIEGIKFSALFIDRGDIRKISLRSRGSFDVNEFARQHFNGGGHRNAAGGAVKLSLEELKQTYRDLVETYRSQLQESTDEAI